MSKLLVAAVAVSAIAAFNLAPQPVQARHCSLVTATAQGLTQGAATRRADRRLRGYAKRNLSGWHVMAGPRNACPAGAGLRRTCKAAAVVCK